MNSENQLCWECSRATGGCPWSREGKEIPNWEAEKTVIRNEDGTEMSSYKIKKCPLFQKDFPRLRRKFHGLL